MLAVELSVVTVSGIAFVEVNPVGFDRTTKYVVFLLSVAVAGFGNVQPPVASVVIGWPT